MITVSEARDAVNGARSKLAQVTHGAEVLLDQETAQRNAIGRALADGATADEVATLKSDLGTISEELNDLLSAKPEFELRVVRAEQTLRETVDRESKATLKALAQRVRDAAIQYEAALKAPRLADAREAFRHAMLDFGRERKKHQLTVSAMFEWPGNLIDSLERQRSGQNTIDDANYNRPVPSFVAEATQEVEGL